jgi:O-acetyl-ADP-ribose deacetylase (regulator of RNase III)
MFKRIIEKIRPLEPKLIDRISIEYGAILSQDECESILFFMYPDLKWGGGLNRTILELAGQEIDHFVCENIYKPKNGDVFALPGFKSPYKMIFMAVLGRWDGGVEYEDREILNCYRRAIRLAKEQGIKTIGIPAMGRDKRDFPHIRFARLALKGVNETIDSSIDRVVFYCPDKRTLNTYQEQMARLRGDLTW